MKLARTTARASRAGEVPIGDDQSGHSDPRSGLQGASDLPAGPVPIAGPVALEQRTCEPVAGASGEGRGSDRLLQREGGGERGDGLVMATEQAEQHAPVAVRGTRAHEGEPPDDQLAGVGRQLVDEQSGMLCGPQAGDDLCGLGERKGPRPIASQPGQVPDQTVERFDRAGEITGHDLADFGLDPAERRAALQPYIDRFVDTAR